MTQFFSLENLCLKSIAKDFERFHYAFAVLNNDTLKRNFQFLRRKYSSELAPELCGGRRIKIQFLDFILNEHLKKLYCFWLEGSPYQNRVQDILCRLPNLTEIFCISLHNGILENIAKFCPKIVQIDALDCYVTDRGVKYLYKNKGEKVPCPELKRLLIGRTFDGKVTFRAMERLIHDLPSLEEISFSNIPGVLYSLHKRDLPNLENVRSYNFIDLDLVKFVDIPHYTDLLKICLNVCPKLETLKCPITNKEQVCLFDNICVKRLHLYIVRGHGIANINDFLNNIGHKLVFLYIQSSATSIFELARSCPKLEVVITEEVKFLHSDNSQITFDCLRECTFCGIKDDVSTNAEIGLLLSSSPNLKYIQFSDCDLSHDMKIHILKCCENLRIECIEFRYVNNVDVDFVKHIALSCPSLENLVLKVCYYSDREEEELNAFSDSLFNKPSINIFPL